MARANSDNSITSRRRFLTVAAAASAVSATALAAGAMPVHQVCTPMQVDPIHAAIAKHTAAVAALEIGLHAMYALEEELPRERRKTNITLWETVIVQTDDPRWIDSEKNVMSLYDAQEDVILGLVSVKPTTVAGLASLMRHVAAYEADGSEWPMFKDDEGDRKDRDFSYFLHRNLAAALTT